MPKDPFPYGVEMASIRNPDELLRENKDLRKKVAYLEDKVAYLTELYKVISEEPERIIKKRFIVLFRLIRDERKNIRRLCAISDVSPKCFYAHRKGPSVKEISDKALIVLIKQIQQEYGNSIGYRKMQDRLHDDYEITIGRQKVLHLMGTANMLSAVRRKHFTEEYI